MDHKTIISTSATTHGFHISAVGNPAEEVSQQTASLQGPAVSLREHPYYPLQDQAVRPLGQPWSNNPALDSSNSVPYTVDATPTTPQTQPRPPNKIRQSQQTHDATTYTQSAQRVPGSDAVSKHDIKSEHGTSSQLISRISKFPSQMHGCHEPSDAYVKNISNALHLYSAQSSQLSPLHHRPSSQTPQLPSLPASRTPHTLNQVNEASQNDFLNPSLLPWAHATIRYS